MSYFILSHFGERVFRFTSLQVRNLVLVALAVGVVGLDVVVGVKVEIGVTFDEDGDDNGLCTSTAFRRMLESFFPSSDFITGLDDGPWRRWCRKVRRLTEFTEEENE